ncbi:MAG: hypothetical protein Athens071416_608 [Parcubacteria group bacterium Athens0714_16]|nr:MAG: hypothetical protein Athens071416_608 [Parcubacteria group bacterium Athens0714_16]
MKKNNNGQYDWTWDWDCDRTEEELRFLVWISRELTVEDAKEVFTKLTK